MSSHRPDANTPALDEFLGAGRMRRLRGDECRAFVHEVFTAYHAADAPGLAEEDHPYRVMVVWRIARVMASIAGLCSEDETLDDATEVEPNPWVAPFKPLLTPVAQAALRRERASRLLTLLAGGLPLLPPRSDPDGLDRWCRAASLIAKDLGIERSREGLRGLQGLLDPRRCAQCDVSAGEVIAFEELMLDEAQDLFLDKGERVTIAHFREKYGMARRECQGVLRLVKSQALRQTQASVEEKRALQERRIENYLARCKETLDMDGEMKALKELAKIQGLTRTDPEDQGKEFFDVVRRVAARQDSELLDAQTLALLDGRRAEEVEPITIEAVPADDPDDAEALAEFDAEQRS